MVGCKRGWNAIWRKEMPLNRMRLDCIGLRMGIYGDGVPTPYPTYVAHLLGVGFWLFLKTNRCANKISKKKIKIPEGGGYFYFSMGVPEKKNSQKYSLFF